ncbi:nicotinamidase-like amidase [Beggiatoa alba B18LD]|uniref:Nicotinamidase-like amidase n=1 Tax=Beggiatoa alba B18LD TaxID=395493 RepID=I3CCI6_9GAMM|nr:hydrolase [Beggiatoa alba]EIJ41329.1 nicotinamidase-like amidase [Beggiatoa alba B18LD]
MCATDSCLLIIDVQARLVPAMVEAERLIASCQTLMQVANRLQIPLLVSEQYPSGLGQTVSELRDLAPHHALMEKVHFSCTESELCLPKIQAVQRKQFILGGIESHVCVQQTAFGLLKQGFEVFLVENAVSSRKMSDKTLALARMQAAGISIVSQEMVIFEWLQQAGTAQFKEISQQFVK